MSKPEQVVGNGFVHKDNVVPINAVVNNGPSAPLTQRDLFAVLFMNQILTNSKTPFGELTVEQGKVAHAAWLWADEMVKRGVEK